MKGNKFVRSHCLLTVLVPEQEHVVRRIRPKDILSSNLVVRFSPPIFITMKRDQTVFTEYIYLSYISY